MAYRSNHRAVQAKIAQATDAGLQAAGQVLINEVKAYLDPPHYFTGWANEHGMLTGTLLAGVVMTEPHDAGGFRQIKVGTDVAYAAYWELGFWMRMLVWHDEKSGSFKSKPGVWAWRRYERWRPAFVASVDRQQAAFARVFERVMAAA